MSNEGVFRLRRSALLCLLILSVAVGLAVAAKPDSANKMDGSKTRYWVSRRHEDSPDKKGNLAVAIQLIYDSDEDETVARIWQYPGLKDSKTLYDDAAVPVLVCRCEIDVIGTNANIKLEKITLFQDDTKIGWITRWHGGKGAGVHKGRRHTRLIFRYAKDFPSKGRTAKANQKTREVTADDDGCEEAPDDNVLEEESLEPPMDPETTPPEISYEP